VNSRRRGKRGNVRPGTGSAARSRRCGRTRLQYGRERYPERRSGRTVAPARAPHGGGVTVGARICGAQSGGQKRGRAENSLRRLAGRIDCGLETVAADLPVIQGHVDVIRRTVCFLGPIAARRWVSR
jgi:hypothetical protein